GRSDLITRYIRNPSGSSHSWLIATCWHAPRGFPHATINFIDIVAVGGIKELDKPKKGTKDVWWIIWWLRRSGIWRLRRPPRWFGGRFWWARRLRLWRPGRL